MKCKNCVHYELYKMITNGQPFGYSGDLPCIRCIHFEKNDEYEPKIESGYNLYKDK